MIVPDVVAVFVRDCVLVDVIVFVSLVVILRVDDDDPVKEEAAEKVAVLDTVFSGVAPILDDGEIVDREDAVVDADALNDAVLDAELVSEAVTVLVTVPVNVTAAVGGNNPESYGGIMTPRNDPIEPALAITLLDFVAVLYRYNAALVHAYSMNCEDSVRETTENVSRVRSKAISSAPTRDHDTTENVKWTIFSPDANSTVDQILFAF